MTPYLRPDWSSEQPENVQNARCPGGVQCVLQCVEWTVCNAPAHIPTNSDPICHLTFWSKKPAVPETLLPRVGLLDKATLAALQVTNSNTVQVLGVLWAVVICTIRCHVWGTAFFPPPLPFRNPTWS